MAAGKHPALDRYGRSRCVRGSGIRSRSSGAFELTRPPCRVNTRQGLRWPGEAHVAPRSAVAYTKSSTPNLTGMRPRLLPIAILALLSAAVPARPDDREKGLPFLRNYSPKEYG